MSSYIMRSTAKYAGTKNFGQCNTANPLYPCQYNSRHLIICCLDVGKKCC
uniref:Uncharacterized protein n=1 Tax=Arundo donax TaxID=35708 RepID=A0A0A8XMZ3_ARUDO